MSRIMRRFTVGLAFVAGVAVATGGDLREGYYRQPALVGETIVFVSEGDLWRVGAGGGDATRLTTDADAESGPVISPDGATIAFVAHYEGPAALYTMPTAGGQPRRWTFLGARLRPASWTLSGRLLYATSAFSTLPDMQLVELDPKTGAERRIELAQAADGCYDDAGSSLFFVRYPFQGSHTKRYHGGTAQRLWRWDGGDAEAVPLTADYAGTSRDPMWWRGRLYFASDRDGTMNIWSMLRDGSDLEQHTAHVGWDVLSPSLSEGRVVYQLGADMWLLDLATGVDAEVPVRLVSDFDQTLERWIEEPLDYLSAAHLAPDGERVALTARGEVFVAPRGPGRLVHASRASGVRYRDARFMPDGRSLLTLSDESGEVELWTLPANGVGDPGQLTSDGEVLRWEAVPSPDGTLVAHDDKNNRLFVLDLETGNNTEIDRSEVGRFSDLAWSPDGRWLAYVVPATNLKRQVRLYRVADHLHAVATSDRYESFSPRFSADGEWLYFLSDRHFDSLVKSPWGDLQPEPYFDKTTGIFMLALRPGLRSPFAPADELHHEEEKGEKEKPAEKTGRSGDPGCLGDEATPPEVRVKLDGLAERLLEVPTPPANAGSLAVAEKALFWLERTPGEKGATLRALEIARTEPKPVTIASGLEGYELSADGRRLLVRTKKALHVVEAKPKKATLDDKTRIDLEGWRLPVVPEEEWRQMFLESWRLERDYFYDRRMHGVDWVAIRDRYLPLVDRIRDRRELADLMAQMTSELGAIHTFVYGGDLRTGEEAIEVGDLGALLERDPEAGGYRVVHVVRSDPDQPGRRSPLAAPEVGVGDGDLVLAVNGRPALEVRRLDALLRNEVGKQVLLEVAPADGSPRREVVVTPISSRAAADLRYHEWEYTRRLRVEEAGGGAIGYVHLRAMGPDDIGEWARSFYPVFDRQGLIVDVRHNRGGNIDSWIIEKLLRKAWAAWSDRVARPTMTNMQYAFRGHLVFLCDAWTASDGEAFLEGVRRLGLGPIVGVRTWGGGIWLTSSNRLVDRGIATAAEFGLFGPEGVWLVEGDGVTPDVVVDNLPHAAFSGEDAELEAAIALLKERIASEPVPPLVPPPPKSLALPVEAGPE